MILECGSGCVAHVCPMILKTSSRFQREATTRKREREKERGRERERERNKREKKKKKKDDKI